MNEATKKYNEALFLGSKHIIKQNYNTPYKGTPEDKLKILEILDKKFENALTFSNKIRGHKSLLYYTVFGVDYTMLVEVSLKTLVINKVNRDFDLLFITDLPTLKLLNTIECLKEFVWNYHIVETPEDGIDASVAKIKIYSYSKVLNYNKILFLDADVICRGNFLDIFNTPTEGKLEVVISPLVKRVLPEPLTNLIKSTTLSHSLCSFTEKNKQFILKNNPLIFNAGHFYFENTEQMEQHFKNIIWLMSVWPSAYFYEQSFMNQYFNLNGLASYNTLNKHTIVTRHVLQMNQQPSLPTLEKQHDDTNTLIHFAGLPTDGRNKYRFIQYYCNYFNICL